MRTEDNEICRHFPPTDIKEGLQMNHINKKTHNINVFFGIVKWHKPNYTENANEFVCRKQTDTALFCLLEIKPTHCVLHCVVVLYKVTLLIV